MLNILHFPSIQRNIDSTNNIADCFLIPALKESQYYDRGTGFFSISGLLDLFPGLIPLVKNHGRVRCLTSAQFSQNDLETIKDAYEIKKNKTFEIIQNTIREQLLLKPQEQKVLDVITNLIAVDLIQIKIAVMKTESNYHEKIGLITDEDGNAVYFTGSANETLNGSKYNRESVCIVSSWTSSENKRLIDAEKEYFERLWTGNDESVSVFSFPEALKKELLSIYKSSDSWEKAYQRLLSDSTPSVGGDKEHRQYQDDAVEVFTNNNGVAFFEMATGTGKTYTAIKALKSLSLKHNEPLLIVILVPLVDLQLQWEENLKKQGIEAILIGGQGEPSTKNHIVIDFLSESKTKYCVCVYNTFFQGFYKELEPVTDKMAIVVDEAHNLGPGYMEKLSSSICYRLGLSATPSRYNPKETETLLRYFLKPNEEPFVYGLDEAINAGYLSKYTYKPLFVRLSEEEMNNYSYYSKKIASLMNIKDRTPEEEKKLTSYRSQRSSIIKHAEEKFSLLESMVASEDYDFTRSVVYCGGGGQLSDNEDDFESSIQRVLGLLNSHGLLASGYMNKTNNRKNVLEQFRKDLYTTLVAIKCFDEGIDVPSLERLYIIASDSTVRQTIQRRGRVLRVCKESGKNIASIFDMVVLPNTNDAQSSKTLIVNELNRVKAYAELALNYENELKDIILELEKKFNISEEDYKICLLEQQTS